MKNVNSGLREFCWAHDEELWVPAPGLKIVHPRSASLNNIELLEVLVPVTIGSPDDVLGLLVRVG